MGRLPKCYQHTKLMVLGYHSTHLLAYCAELHRGEPGPAHSLYADLPFKGAFKKILSTSKPAWLPLKLAITGTRLRSKGIYQCRLCSRYILNRKKMIQHLRSCAIPEVRLKNTRWHFPCNAKGGLFCPICLNTAETPRKLARHFVNTHYTSEDELHVWGVDRDLIEAQVAQKKPITIYR